MHFHLRYLRFLLFQIPFLIRETLTAGERQLKFSSDDN